MSHQTPTLARVVTGPVRPRQTWNTALAAQEIRVAGDWVEADTPEAAQGRKDLNGDGDASDIVPQLVNLKSREMINTRLAAGSSAALTPRLFVQTATPDGKERLLLCLNTTDGKTIWSQKVPGTKAAPAWRSGSR